MRELADRGSAETQQVRRYPKTLKSLLAGTRDRFGRPVAPLSDASPDAQLIEAMKDKGADA